MSVSEHTSRLGSADGHSFIDNKQHNTHMPSPPCLPACLPACGPKRGMVLRTLQVVEEAGCGGAEGLVQQLVPRCHCPTPLLLRLFLLAALLLLRCGVGGGGLYEGGLAVRDVVQQHGVERGQQLQVLSPVAS